MIVEMVCVVMLYVASMVVYKSRLVGTWAYRGYKCMWGLMSFIAILFFIIDLYWTFDLRFWLGLDLAVRVNANFNLNLTFQLDLMQTMASTVVFLDGLSLIILVLTLVLTLICPSIAQKLPLPASMTQCTHVPS